MQREEIRDRSEDANYPDEIVDVCESIRKEVMRALEEHYS